MSERKLVQRVFSLTLVALLLAGCGGSPDEPTATSVSALRTAASTSVSPTFTLTTVPPASTLTPVPPTTTPIGSGGQIAFMSQRDDNYEIYVMNADGSGQINLTNHGANDKRPSMSPDGKRIAFISDRDSNTEIYLINADGTGLVRLTDTPGWEDFPRWSPDGRQIVFVRDLNVVVMGPDGSNQISLTGDPWADHPPVYAMDGMTLMPGADLYPAWLPDGSRVVFLSFRDRSFQFYVVNSNGTGLTILDSGLPPSEFTTEETVSLVRVGLDQDYLAGAGFQGSMNDTGRALGELPAWSPDGTRIAFHSDRDGDLEIYVVSADRSEIVQLTDNEATDVYPTWSPDGARIVFASDRDGNLEIYAMNADGTEQTRLTDNSASDYQPSWYR